MTTDCHTASDGNKFPTQNVRYFDLTTTSIKIYKKNFIVSNYYGRREIPVSLHSNKN